ncbi:MAG: PIN domain-containing protein [Gammaproteobacteria bacterium]|nr:PIN domain-containing protein [Gammaproteobacteria bacterium]
MYMLDTNTCIYVLKNHSLHLQRKFKSIKDLCISSITFGELCYGIENGAAELREGRYQQLKLFVRNLLVDPWDEKSAYHYGSIRADLKRQGNIIGNNDLLIAAHARSLNAVLVTNNEHEFRRVAELKIENWLNS